MKTRILSIDDNKTYLENLDEFLRQQNFSVVSTSDVREGIGYLDTGNFDIAIIDLKLVNGDDPDDFSGLDIAKRHGQNIPKIINTGYPSLEAVRAALGTQIDGLPPCVDFVCKDEGYQTLLTAIRKINVVKKDFQSQNAKISTEISKDYKNARTQQWIFFITALVCAVAGLIIVFVGFKNLVLEKIELAIFEGSITVITTAISILFFKQSSEATKRMDRFHKELRNTQQLENLILACEEISDSVIRDKTKESIISGAIKNSFE